MHNSATGNVEKGGVKAKFQLKPWIREVKTTQQRGEMPLLCAGKEAITPREAMQQGQTWKCKESNETKYTRKPFKNRMITVQKWIMVFLNLTEIENNKWVDSVTIEPSQVAVEDLLLAFTVPLFLLVLRNPKEELILRALTLVLYSTLFVNLLFLYLLLMHWKKEDVLNLVNAK